MSDTDATDRLAPTWRTALATAVGYGGLLVAITVVLFVLPFAVFVVF